MVAILNVTKGKRKVIVSGLAGALSALIFLTAIHIAAKIAIIVSAAAVTYLLLSLIHKIRTKKEQPAEITGVSGDKVSEDEGYSSVDGNGKEDKEDIAMSRKEQEIEAKSEQDDTGQTQYKEDYMDLMRSLPMHMDGAYQEIKEPANAPRTSFSGDLMRMPERLTAANYGKY